MTDLKHLIEDVEEALQAAWNGLTWYREEHPQDASEADNEMDEQIEAALTRLSQLRESVPEDLTYALTPFDEGGGQRKRVFGFSGEGCCYQGRRATFAYYGEEPSQ